MRRLGQALVAASLLVGCGGPEFEPSSEPSSERFNHQEAPLTTTDVDVAPECQGLLRFVNTASYATLDAYLPSDVASNLVARRASAPFVSLADVSSVRGVGPARLDQIESGARARGYLGASCVGILDNLALSTDDAAALVSLVNGVSDSELHDILPDAWNGAANLLNLRPFTSAQAIANVAGVGEVSLRNLRNSATLSRPFEALVAAVNDAPQSSSTTAALARHFDWWRVVTDRYYQFGGLECFGLEPSSVPHGAQVRPTLADAAEVRAAVQEAVAIASPRGQISRAVIDAGMANLEARITGRAFKGCTFGFARDPWSGRSGKIFVDTVNGFSVFVDTGWVE
jgi:hypothetical protein